MRLFRCLNESEQSVCVTVALGVLAKRYELAPFASAQARDENTAEYEENINSSLMCLWPANWPGQVFVDLDNTGDPSAWLVEVLGEDVADFLFGGAWNDAANAQDLAEAYRAELKNQRLDLPSDFDGVEETPNDLALFQEEFAAFLCHWRERVLTTLETQKLKPPVGIAP